MKNKKISNKSKVPQKLVKKINTIGFWLCILGVLYIVLTPLITFLFYSKASSMGYSKKELVIASIILGLILGAIFIRQGVVIRKTNSSDIRRTDRLLLFSVIYIIFVVILGLVGGRLKGITGLLDLITLVQIVLARNQIKKLSL